MAEPQDVITGCGVAMAKIMEDRREQARRIGQLASEERAIAIGELRIAHTQLGLFLDAIEAFSE